MWQPNGLSTVSVESDGETLGDGCITFWDGSSSAADSDKWLEVEDETGRTRCTAVVMVIGAYVLARPLP